MLNISKKWKEFKIKIGCVKVHFVKPKLFDVLSKALKVLQTKHLHLIESNINQKFLQSLKNKELKEIKFESMHVPNLENISNLNISHENCILSKKK